MGFDKRIRLSDRVVEVPEWQCGDCGQESVELPKKCASCHAPWGEFAPIEEGPNGQQEFETPDEGNPLR